MKKRNIVIISACVGALVITGAILGIVFSTKASNENKEELYQVGLKHLIDREFKEAAEIFGSRKLRHYKDTSKKYNYSINLQRYEQRYYTYEDLIDYGLSEKDSVAVIDFNTLGGQEIPRKTINKKQSGRYITEVATKEHCDFASWMLTFASYELNTDSIRYILDSKYSDHAYTITYELDGGSGVDRLPNKFYYDRGDVSIPNSTKVGYDFVGYESNLYEDVRKDFVIPNHTDVDVTLTAKYEPLTYTVTLNANGGTVDPSVISGVTFGEDVAYLFPTPTKDYFTFSHWTYNGEIVDLSNWSIAEDVELLAQYTPTQYSISYNLNGARYFGLPTKYDYSMQINLPYVEKKDALFRGWKKYGDATEEDPNYQIGYNAHGDLRFDAIFVDATIDENGVLQDISDKTIKRFVIPSYVTDINPELVYQMPNLLNIFADAKNKHFKMDERLLVKDDHIAFAHPISFSGHKINLSESITEIAENAFRGTEITEINGSSLVEKIGANAFRDCSNLEQCNLSNIKYVGNCAFENSKVNEGFLDANVNSLSHIGDYAFKGSKVAKVDIGSAVQHIGDGAFANLSGFNTVNFYPDINSEIGDNLFEGCTGIKTLNTDTRFFEKLMTTSFNETALTTINLKGSTPLSAHILENKTSLKSVDLSETSLVDIPVDAFKGDTSLESVTLPASLRRIQAGAFEGCEKLSSVNFAELSKLVRIESGAFVGNDFEELDFTTSASLTLSDNAFTSSSKLTSIKLRHGQVTTRMADVFNLCGKINQVVYEIGETSDETIILPDFLFEDLNNVASIEIKYLGSGDKLITFGTGGFKNCATLANLTMTNCHVSSIPNYCFEGCVSLINSNEVFSNLTSYGEGAFYGCTNLNTMSFEGTDIIGMNAFAGCFKLLTLEIPHNDNLTIGQAAFAETTGAITIHYTEAEVNTFRNTYHKWYHFDEGFSGILNCVGND